MNRHANTIITNLLTMKYNVGAVILTILLWVFCSLKCYSYKYWHWNRNSFDMISTVESYIAEISFVSILIGALGHDRWRKLIKLGTVTSIVAIFALVTYKSKSGFGLGLGLWVLSPVSMFCFFILIKNIWVVSSSKLAKSK